MVTRKMLERNTKIASSVVKIIQTQNKPVTVKVMIKLEEMVNST